MTTLCESWNEVEVDVDEHLALVLEPDAKAVPPFENV